MKEKVRMAVIRRLRLRLRAYPAAHHDGRCRVAAVCDLYEDRVETALKLCENKYRELSG